jgi:hypothetical protein
MLVVAVVDITTLIQALAKVQMVLGAVAEQTAAAAVLVQQTAVLVEAVVRA